MIKLISTPNLPISKVKHCLIGEKNADEISELSDLGVICIGLKENSELENEINSHADILSFNFGSGQVLVNKESIGEGELEKAGINRVLYSGSISSPYPKDVSLNVAFIGKNIICNIKHTDRRIIEFAKKRNFNLIDTNQGYARCNICIVTENAVITEDSGLETLLKKYQIDVLKISYGDVNLSEKHYGFLGGASCKISKEAIYFSGNLEMHSDYDKIIKFLNKHHIKPIYNRNRNLRDFGGIIQLTEEK